MDREHTSDGNGPSLHLLYWCISCKHHRRYRNRFWGNYAHGCDHEQAIDGLQEPIRIIEDEHGVSAKTPPWCPLLPTVSITRKP